MTDPPQQVPEERVPGTPAQQGPNLAPPVYYQKPPTNSTATTALICGVLAVTCFGFITGIPAIFIGIAGKKKSKKMDGEGSGQAISAIVLGVIGTVVSIALITLLTIQTLNLFNSGKEKLGDVTSDLGKTLKDPLKEAERSGDRAKASDYLISNTSVVVQPSGNATFSATFQNKADFSSAYNIEIECVNNLGTTLVGDGTVSRLKTDQSETVSIELPFESGTTSVRCDVSQVTYAISIDGLDRNLSTQ